jgi:hypothetical protein
MAQRALAPSARSPVTLGSPASSRTHPSPSRSHAVALALPPPMRNELSSVSHTQTSAAVMKGQMRPEKPGPVQVGTGAQAAQTLALFIAWPAAQAGLLVQVGVPLERSQYCVKVHVALPQLGTAMHWPAGFAVKPGRHVPHVDDCWSQVRCSPVQLAPRPPSRSLHEGSLVQPALTQATQATPFHLNSGLQVLGTHWASAPLICAQAWFAPHMPLVTSCAQVTAARQVCVGPLQVVSPAHWPLPSQGQPTMSLLHARQRVLSQ